MLNHVVIYYNTLIDGTINVESFFLDAAGQVQANSDLEIISNGDIIINGVIKGADDSGADIKLTSNYGHIFVKGSIQGGSGESYFGLAPLPRPHGRRGGKGGNVIISAPNDEVRAWGSVKGGKGGKGEDAIELTGGDQRVATSGGGGNGGTVSISSGLEIRLLGGELKGGHGGDGGRAVAGFWTEEELMQTFAFVQPPEFPPELLVPTNPQPQVHRIAVATAGGGGEGGSVNLTLTQNAISVVINATVEAGNGGHTEEASATYGEEGTATANEAGKGGNVTIDLSHAGWLSAGGNTPKPGDGGHCGQDPTTRRATAGGRNRATARVGQGGAGGTYTDGRNQQHGQGGNAGLARAATQGCDNSRRGQNGQRPQPGAGGYAACP